MVSKSIIFLEKSFLATFIDIWRCFSGHTDLIQKLKSALNTSEEMHLRNRASAVNQIQLSFAQAVP